MEVYHLLSAFSNGPVLTVDSKKGAVKKINATYAFKFPAGNLIQISQFTIVPFCKQTELFSSNLQLKRFASRLLLMAFSDL